MKQKIILVNDDGRVRNLLDGATDPQFEIVDAAPDQAVDTLHRGVMSVVIMDDSQSSTLIGNSVIARHLREKIKIIAETGAPALISGECGTGKETAARAIHAASGLAGPFIKVNCPPMPAALLERELFGDVSATGQLELARGGTVLLDEIGEMDAVAQARLLQAMDRGQLEEVRVIATTTRDLSDRFREDLYYRLSVVTLEMPPLRSRREDISLLIEHFVGLYALRNGRERIRLTAAAVEKLTRAHWDGNIRQLESVIERAAILSSGQTLDAESFRFENSREEQMLVVEETFRHGSIREMEKLMIINRLRENEDNRTRSSKTLDISVRTLRNKLHEYNVPRKTRTVPAKPVAEPALV